MFNAKFKQYISKKESIFLNCLHKCGFSDQEILATLSIVLSFYQKTVFYVDTSTRVPSVKSNDKIIFEIGPTDIRNFMRYKEN